MGRVRQTLERRQLGLSLRRLRERADLTQQAAADALGKVRSRIVDLEDGRSTANADDLDTLLELYHASDHERSDLIALGARSRKRQRRQTTFDLLPVTFERFAELEASAEQICAFEPSLIPGLLQSPGYVRALVAEGDGIWWEPSVDESTERVAFREHRQRRVLGGSGPRQLRFVVSEESLRAVVGDQAVMREQLQRILDLIEDRPGLTIRVLLTATPGNPARAGGFNLFRFGDRGNPIGATTMVFGPDRYVEDETDVSMLDRAFERVNQLALDQPDSQELITKILEGSG